MIMGMDRGFLPVCNYISSFARLENPIRRRHFDHNCLVLITRPCMYLFEPQLCVKVCEYFMIYSFNAPDEENLLKVPHRTRFRAQTN